MEQICRATNISCEAVQGVLLHDLLNNPYKTLRNRCTLDECHVLAEYIGIPIKYRVLETLSWHLSTRPLATRVAFALVRRDFDIPSDRLETYFNQFVNDELVYSLCDHLIHEDDWNALTTVASYIRTNNDAKDMPFPRIAPEMHDPDTVRALEMIKTHRFSVITGDAGTGKSYCIKTLMSMCDVDGKVCRIVAPNAHPIFSRASRVASTFHTIQEAPDEFIYACDILIIDDASMLSAQLFCDVLRNVDDSRTRIVLVGDTNQLPPIGVGYVIRDMLSYGCPSVRFTTPYRSPAIHAFVQRVLDGHPVDTDTCHGCHVSFIACETWDRAVNAMPDASGWTITPPAQLVFTDTSVETSLQTHDDANESYYSEDRQEEQERQLMREEFGDGYEGYFGMDNYVPVVPESPPRMTPVGDSDYRDDWSRRARVLEHSISTVLVPRKSDRDHINTVLQLCHHASTECDIRLQTAYDTAPRGTRGVACIERISSGTGLRIVADDHDVDFRVTPSAAPSLVSIDNRPGIYDHDQGVLPNDPILVTKATLTMCLGQMGISAGDGRIATGDQGIVELPTGQASSWTLAYAMTVHKSQGGEFASVTLPIVRVNTWTREMFYTAITRAKHHVYLLGSPEDVEMIIKQPHTQQPPYLLELLKNTG